MEGVNQKSRSPNPAKEDKFNRTEMSIWTKRKSDMRQSVNMRRSFYFDKPTQPSRCLEVVQVHGKSTPIGYIHHTKPLLWTAKAPENAQPKNNNKCWRKNPFTGMFEPKV